MIWESTVLMTIIDLVIIFLTFILFWNFYQNKRTLKHLKMQYSIVIILCGFSIMALLYLGDLLTMHFFPRFMSMEKSMEIMTELHLNYNWVLSSAGFGLLFIGILYLNKISFPECFLYQKNLENEIIKRNRVEKEYKKLNKKLELKNREIEQMIYIMSHDLRSPLININGFTNEIENSLAHLSTIMNVDDVPLNIREKVVSILDDDISESVRFITSSITQMDSLFDRILKLSRTGQVELTIKKLDTNNMLSNVIRSLKFRIEEVEASIKVSSLPSCMGDETQINQVFSNLLSNALKYQDPERPCNIIVSGHIEGKMAVYCIEDNGIGISAEYHERIFGFFSQIAPTKRIGEGLGLAIVKKIIERHHGKVWVESESSKGSKFFVLLPTIQRDKIQIIK